MCSPACFDWWSRLLALADGQADDDAGWSRRGFLAASAATVLATAAPTSAAPSPEATRELLDAAFSFDLHSHPGLFKSQSNDTLAGHRQSAEAGHVKLITLTATSDAPVISRDRSGALRASRQPNPGELYASMYRQLDALVKWSADHVALGTDMDGIGPGAVFTSYARWPSLAAALLDRGYRPDEVGKILGGNARRVFRRVGEAARKS